MDDVTITTKDRLEESKLRLSKAFKQLEHLVDGKLDIMLSAKNNSSAATEEIKHLKNEVVALESKNKALSDEYARLRANFDTSKKVSSEVLDEIHQTIDTLEGLLKQDGDS
jgi:predicted  nucleic acid-binding Zn-ribbon protein